MRQALKVILYIIVLPLCMLIDPKGLESSAETAPAAVLEKPETPASGTDEGPVTKEDFSLEKVEALAEELARAAYVRPAQPPKFLSEISEAQWNAVTFRADRRLWKNEGLPFEVEFFHPGFIFDQTVAMNIVDGSTVEPLAFDADHFFNPDWELSEKVKRAQDKKGLGFAGFRLLFPLNDTERKNEYVSFLGATHFRALPRHSGYGLTARGLILNPAMPEGEEFPYFRRFWLVKPKADDKAITVYALMDSPSLTGAYRFIITPGPTTVMEVSARLFARNGGPWPKKIGLAPTDTMYLFSEKENGQSNDWRPEAHSSDVLLWKSGEKNWNRRPLNNPKRLDITSYDLPNPMGFGLMQQDASFDHYQDLKARFDLRPSLWVEPQGDWGAGRLELIEIPSSQEIHDNILTFWVPDNPVERNLSYDYNLYWMPAGATPHQMGKAVSTRLSQAQNGEGLVRFIIDFEGGQLNDIPAEAGLASVVEVGPEASVVEKSLIKNTVTGGWRLEFKVRPPEEGMMQSLMNARGERKGLRLKAFLKKGENLPESLTECWTYDWPY